MRSQRRLQHGAKQLALARVRANVRVADGGGIDDAADDERGAAAAGERLVGEQRGDGLLRAALNDLHAPGDRARVGLVREEAVMVRLPRFGDVRIAELDDPPRDRRRRGGGAAQRHGNREPRLHAKAEGRARHFISSLTSAYAMAEAVNVL